MPLGQLNLEFAFAYICSTYPILKQPLLFLYLFAMLIFQVCATGVSLSELLSALFFLTAVFIYFPQNNFSNQNFEKSKSGKEKKEEIEEEKEKKVTKEKQGKILMSSSCPKTYSNH